MGKPVERQNHSLSFFILAALIAICTGWAFYEEFLGRRPWKYYQQHVFDLEKEKASTDLDYYRRQLDSGQIKVVLDPSKPDQKTTVAGAEKQLAAIDQALAKERGEIEKIRSELKDAEIENSDADIKVKLLRSEDDGLFYRFQNAEHEEALANARSAKLRAEGKSSEAEAAHRAAEEHRKVREEVERERAQKAEEIRNAEAAAEKAARKLAEIDGRLKSKVGARDRLKAAIDAAKDPVITAKSTLEAAARKGSELTQYWLTSYDNSVDRCQNCHALVDKCGYSRPHEVLVALAAPNAKPEDVLAKYCVNPDTLASYQATAAEVCALEFDRPASEKGQIAQGRCFAGDERVRVSEFLHNYCGPEAAPVRFLHDKGVKAGCIAGPGLQTLANYVEDIGKRGA